MTPTPRHHQGTPSAIGELPLKDITFAIIIMLGLLIAVHMEKARGPALSSHFPGSESAEILTQLLTDEKPHPIGSLAHKDLANRIVQKLKQAGLNPRIQRTQYCSNRNICAELNNIVVHLPGEKPGALLLSAHYDSVPASPGAGDDGAAVAVLIQAAENWSKSSSTNSLILLLSDGEELGLLGAQAFMNEHPLAQTVRAALNLEGRGSSGPAWMFEQGPDSYHLLQAFAATSNDISSSSVAESVYRQLGNATDVDIYSQHKIPSLNFAFIGSSENYHTRNDTLANLSPRSIQAHGQNIWGLTETLKSADLTAVPNRNIVFFTLFGRLILAPIWVMWTFTLLVCVGLSGYLVKWPIKSFGKPIFQGLGYLIGCTTIGLILVECFNFSAISVIGWTNAPNACTASLVITLVAWTSEWKRLNKSMPQTSFLALLCAYNLLLSALTLLIFPTASYLFCLPALVAFSGLLVARANPRFFPIGTGMVSACVIMLWFPLISGLYSALMLHAAPLIGLCLGFILLPISPFIPVPTNQSRGLALATVAFTLVLIVAASPSATHNPRLMNLVHSQDLRQDVARLSLISSPTPLPQKARELRSLKEQGKISPWIQQPVNHRLTPIAPSTLEIFKPLSTGKDFIEGQLIPPAGSSVIGLAFPKDAAVDAIQVNGKTLHLVYRNNWALLELHGFTDAAHIRYPATASSGLIQAFSTQYGLPDTATPVGEERDLYGMPFGRGDRSILYHPADHSFTPEQAEPKAD